MKIRPLLEGRYGQSRTPVDVRTELERPNPQGENGWDSFTVTITGFVTAERDPYGTGDSPTEYMFEPQSAVVDQTGQPFDVKTLDDQEWDAVQNQAIAQANS